MKTTGFFSKSVCFAAIFTCLAVFLISSCQAQTASTVPNAGFQAPIANCNLLSDHNGSVAGASGLCTPDAGNSLEIKGPMPWTDITTYRARGVSSFQTTATCTAGSALVTLASASSFINGDGMSLPGCGATNTMSAPGTPTVTPSLAASSTGTGKVVRSPTGGTSRYYEIIAEDWHGGLTAASTTGSTITGTASLGPQRVFGCTLTRGSTTNYYTHNVVTVTSCSAAASLTSGAVVYFSGAADNSFNGWFTVWNIASASSFVMYPNGEFTEYGGEGAGTSATASVTWFQGDHITWPSVTGARIYYIYESSSSSGPFNYVGSSQPTSYDRSIVPTWFDYWGGTMSGKTTPPWYVPTTASSSATNDFLTTTISAGAGTTNVTLATAASNNATGTTAIFDNAPAILAASSANSEHTVVYIPSGTFVVNSPLILNPSSSALFIRQEGSLTLNGPLTGLVSTKWVGFYDANANAGASFGLNTTSTVTGTAEPLVSLTTSQGITVDGVDFNVEQNNGGFGLVLDNLGTYELRHNVFSTGTGSGDEYTAIGLLVRNAFGAGGATARPVMDSNLFLSDTVSYATTLTPNFLVQGAGTLPIVMNRTMFNARGIAFENGPNWLRSTNLYSQNLAMPFIAIGPEASQAGTLAEQPIELSSNEIDTSIGPLLAVFNAGVNGNYSYYEPYLASVSVNGIYAANGSIVVTGAGFSNLALTSTAGLGTIGQNINVTQNCFGAQSGTANGTTFSALIPSGLGICSSSVPMMHSGLVSEGWTINPPMGMAVTTSSGGSWPTGKYTASVYAVAPDGTVTVSSATASFTIASGRQTVRMSWTAPTSQGGYTVPGLTYCVLINGNQYAGSCGLSGTRATFSSFPGGYVTTAGPAVTTAGYPSIGTLGVFAPNFSSPFILLTDGTKVSWNTSSGAYSVLQFTTHGGRRILNVSHLLPGGNYVLELIQDSTGGEGLTLGTGCAWKVSGGRRGSITLSAGASAIDVLFFTYDGTHCLAKFEANFN